MLTIVLVACGCTLVAVGLALWALGNARAWERHAVAEGVRATHWQAMALRVPRAPVLTQVAPAYHAPRAPDANR